MACFDRLAALTNVVPLIGKSDLLSADEIAALKHEILSKLDQKGTKPFLFGEKIEDILARAGTKSPEEGTSQPTELSIETPVTTESQQISTMEASAGETATEAESAKASQRSAPFAVSSAPGPDLETMDASLLMSPDYCPPSAPSDLQHLIELVFDPENAAWLRHSSARKFLSWRRDIITRNSLDLSFGGSFSPTTAGKANSAWKLGTGIGVGLPAFASGVFSPQHPAYERPNVPKWAASLGKAMRKERERNTDIARKTNFQGGSSQSTLIPARDTTASSSTNSRSTRSSRRPRRPARHWSEARGSPDDSQTMQKDHSARVLQTMSSVVLNTVKVVGTVSAVGVLAAVVARTVFGIEGLEIVALGGTWKWTVVIGEGR